VSYAAPPLANSIVLTLLFHYELGHLSFEMEGGGKVLTEKYNDVQQKVDL
jgi:hypothetical protein